MYGGDREQLTKNANHFHKFLAGFKRDTRRNWGCSPRAMRAKSLSISTNLCTLCGSLQFLRDVGQMLVDISQLSTLWGLLHCFSSSSAHEVPPIGRCADHKHRQRNRKAFEIARWGESGILGNCDGKSQLGVQR